MMRYIKVWLSEFKLFFCDEIVVVDFKLNGLDG